MKKYTEKLTGVQYEMITGVIQGGFWIILGIADLFLPSTGIIHKVVNVFLCVSLLLYLFLLVSARLRGKEKDDEMAEAHMKSARSSGYIIICLLMVFSCVVFDIMAIINKGKYPNVNINAFILIVLGISYLYTGFAYIVLEKEAVSDAEDEDS